MMAFLLVMLLMQKTLVDANGVVIHFRFNGYSNPISRMPNASCPFAYDCPYPSFPAKCRFLFTMLNGDSFHKEETDFFLLDANGQLTQEANHRDLIVQLPKVPSVVQVTSYEYGGMVKPDGETVIFDRTTHTDIFDISLTDVLPSVSGMQTFHNSEYKGGFDGSSLSLSFSITCLGQSVGPFCDLNCITPNINNGSAHCVSVENGDFSICKRLANGQVDKCVKSSCSVKDREPTQLCLLIANDWKSIAVLIMLFVSGFLWGIGITYTRRTMRSVE